MIIIDDTSIGFSSNDVLWLRDVLYCRNGSCSIKLQIVYWFLHPYLNVTSKLFWPYSVVHKTIRSQSSYKGITLFFVYNNFLTIVSNKHLRETNIFYNYVNIRRNSFLFQQKHDRSFPKQNKSLWYQNKIKMTPKWLLKVIFQSFPIHFDVIVICCSA